MFKILFIDPGKRTLLQMMDDDSNYFSLFKNYKDNQHITEIENGLSLLNSKTCDSENFKEYIKEKLKVNNSMAQIEV